MDVRGLEDLTQIYNDFRDDYSKIQSPEIKKQYKKILLDLKKEIDLYKSYMDNMFKSMPSLSTK
jgi:hypothetical protein